ncbi:hypothetical protein [Nocardioides mangrovicus]|uniref:hypothetical protein n=1 Tax=Nocardioides mangrovicus TaxID=2478913 RepID=UPI001E591A0C|nr:hypothetical protein [Nocardioides mangrovicus]
MEVRYLAADTLISLQSPAGEQLIAEGRFTHAYLGGDTHSLCGLSLHRLHWRELAGHNWEDVRPELRCQSCAVSLD